MDLPLVRGPNRLEAKEKARETERSGRDHPSPLSVAWSLSPISVSVSFVCLCLGLCLQSLSLSLLPPICLIPLEKPFMYASSRATFLASRGCTAWTIQNSD